MTVADSEFNYRFVEPAAADPQNTLLLLHGAGGDERDLISLGQRLLPGAALLSPRGRVLEHGMPRFFRRRAEGVFDLADLKLQTDKLAAFITDAARKYTLDLQRIVAVGYSNGANIAASLLLSHPRVLAGAVLFRPMIPFQPETTPDLRDVPVLLAAGRHDQIVPPTHTPELAQIFRTAGARVSIHWHPGGHELGPDDVESAKSWLLDNYGKQIHNSAVKERDREEQPRRE